MAAGRFARPERIEYCTKRPMIVFFLGPTKSPHHMDRQDRTGDAVLVKSTVERQVGPKHCLLCGWGEKE